MADAQTSGGLLLCVARDRVDDLVEHLAGRAPAAAVIGEVTEGRAGGISVR
jgi:hydrogenase maturation factor